MLSIAGRVIGVLAGAAATLLWVAILWFPVGGFMLKGIGMVVGAFMALVALVAAIGAYHGHAIVVFVCFVVSFFGIGAFALNVDHWFRVFGVLDLLMLVACALLWWSSRSEEGVE